MKLVRNQKIAHQLANLVDKIGLGSDSCSVRDVEIGIAKLEMMSTENHILS